jgi:hypothetical protein
MNYSLKELKERFQKILEPEDEFARTYALPKAPQALKEYLLFVGETSPFNTIAREIREKTPTSMTLLDKIHSGTAGTVDMSIARPHVRLFHERLVRETERRVRADKAKIVLDKKNTSVFLFENPKQCYPIKSRGVFAREVPQRFRLILALPKDGSGFSAERLANILKKTDIPGLRKEIREINKNFAQKVSKEGVLIADNERGGKNIYFLNTEIYDFEFK